MLRTFLYLSSFLFSLILVLFVVCESRVPSVCSICNSSFDQGTCSFHDDTKLKLCCGIKLKAKNRNKCGAYVVYFFLIFLRDTEKANKGYSWTKKLGGNMSSQSSRNTQTHKLVLLGDMGTGKSSIVDRFCKNCFKERPDPTIGGKFTTHVQKLEQQSLRRICWRLQPHSVNEMLASKI